MKLLHINALNGINASSFDFKLQRYGYSAFKVYAVGGDVSRIEQPTKHLETELETSMGTLSLFCARVHRFGNDCGIKLFEVDI